MKLRVEGKSYEVAGDEARKIKIREKSGACGAGAVFEAAAGGRSRSGHVAAMPDGGWRVWVDGYTVDVASDGAAGAALAGAAPVASGGLGPVRAAMPCRLVAVLVKAGQAVRAGEPLYRVESMKMEQVVCAPADAVVGDVVATPGRSLARGDVILVLTKG